MCFCSCVYNVIMGASFFLTYLTSSGMTMVGLTPTTGAGSDLEEFDNGYFNELKNILHFAKVGEVLTLKGYVKNHLRLKKLSYFLRILFSSIV